MIVKNEKPLCAISYNTKTFHLVDHFLKKDDPSIELFRIDPKDFIINSDDKYQYVNLVIQDFKERELISNILNQRNHDRFSYIGDPIVICKELIHGGGCIIYPGLSLYSANIGKDVILHGRTSLAEDVKIGNGCFFSGGITIAGDTKIGDFCYVSTSVTIMDHVTIGNRVKLLPSMTIRKSILNEGTYYNPHAFKVKKINL